MNNRSSKPDTFDDLISAQLNPDGGFSANLPPSEVIQTLLSATVWPSRATAAAVLSNTSEALLKSLIELPDLTNSSATLPSSALFAILKSWLTDALNSTPSTLISPFGPASEATAEAISCVLQTLLKAPVDLKRIAASKIGHLVMKLHTKGTEATEAPGGSNGVSLQIQDIYKTATRVVTLWKDCKASKTAQDAAAASTSTSAGTVATKSSIASSSSLPMMATLSSSLKTTKSAAMVIDDDVVEINKKRPRTKEDGGKSASSSTNTNNTSKKVKTEATLSSLSSSSSVETISSSGIGGGKNNTAPLAPLVPLSRLSSSSSSSSSVSTSVSQPSLSMSGGGGLLSSSTDNNNNNNNTVVSNQLSIMSTMDFSNGLGGGLGGSSSMSSFTSSNSEINSIDALDDENHGSSSTYLIDDALDKLDPSAIAWGIPDEDEWSQNVLRTPQGFGDTPYEKTMENDVEPGIPEEEQKGLERMRGLGMPDRYGIVSGGNYDESVQRTLPRGILVNKMLMRVGGLPLRLLDPGTEEAEEVIKQGGSIIVIEGGEGDDGRQADGGGLVEDDKSIVKVEAKPNVTTLDAEKSVGPGGSMMVIGDDDAPPGSDLNVNVGVPPVLSAVTIDAPLPKVDGIEIDSSSSSSSSIVSVTENSSSSTSTGAPIRVKVRRPIRWIDQDENAGPALASKNHFAPCSTYTLNGLVAVRFFDFQTHIVEDPKKAQRAAASAALSSMTSTVAAAEVIVDDAMNATSSETSSSTSSSQSTGDENGGSGAISFEEARKREKSREKSLLATVGSSSTTSTPKKKVLEYQYSSPNTATMTIVPACSAKVSKGWLSPLGPPKLKAPARTPFVSAEAARIEKEMQTNAALKAQLMGQRYIGGRGGAAPVLHPFAWKDKNKIDADPELVTDGLVSSSAVSRSGVSGGAAGGAGVDLSSVQKVFEHIKVRWQFGLFGSGVGGVSNGLMMNPQQLFVQQKFQLQQQAQQQALQLAQQQQQLLLQQQQLQQQIQMQQQLSASGVAVASTTTTTTAATTTSSAGVPSSLSLDTASASAVNAPSSSSATAMAVTPTPVSMSMPMMLFPNAASTMPALSLARPSSVVPTLQQGFFGNSSVTATTTPMMMMMGIGGGVTPATSISGVGKKPCMFFQSKAGCRNGVKCPYLHDPAYKAPQEDFNRISAADKKGHVPQVVVVGNNSNLGGTGVVGGATTASMPQQMQQQPQQQPQMATQGQGWGIQPHWMQQQVQQQQQQQQQPQVYMQQPQQQQHLQPVGWGIQPQSLPQQQQQQQPVGWGIQPQPQQMQMQQPPQVYAQQPGMWPPQQQGHPLPQQQQHQQQMMMMPQSGWSGPVMSVPQQQQQQQQKPQQGWNSGWVQAQPPPM